MSADIKNESEEIVTDKGEWFYFRYVHAYECDMLWNNHAGDLYSIDRRIQQLRKVDVQRKQVIEELQNKLNAAKQESDELSLKCGAHRVRNKNLQDELVTLKSNIRSLNEKSVRDDGSIADLKVLKTLQI